MFYIFVVHKRKVILITAEWNFTFFHGFYHITTLFRSMRTVIVLTIRGIFENFGEILTNFLTFHIKKSEGFYARSVNNIAAVSRFVHFGKGGSMLTFMKRLRNLTRFQIFVVGELFY